eukprot:747585_1
MDESFPAFVCLMMDHAEDAYDEILHCLVRYANDNLDEIGDCLTSKPVRLMGDFSLAEHNSLSSSRHIDVLSDDSCGWHFVNAINDNMNKHHVIGYYINDVTFRKFVRYFECVRGIHLDCAQLAVKLIKTNAWKELSGGARNAYRRFYNEYLEPVWIEKFGLKLLNCKGSFVMDNNFCEGWNRKALMDLGMRRNWWLFCWNLKQWLAVIASRFEAFEMKGFERKRSAQRKRRCEALKAVWDKFDTLDRANAIVVWNYIQCLFLCWENEYTKLKDLLLTL